MLIIAVNKVYNMLGVIKCYADSCYVYTMEYSKVSSSKVRYLLVKYILSITWGPIPKIHPLYKQSEKACKCFKTRRYTENL